MKFIHLPMKMEPIVSSETSAIRTQTPGNYPKSNKLNLEHGESLKTRLITVLSIYVFIFSTCQRVAQFSRNLGSILCLWRASQTVHEFTEYHEEH